MTLASWITLLRFLLVPFFVVILVLYTPEKDFLRTAALLIFLAAGFTDGVDGFLARRFHQWSRLGTILDPLADKFLLVSGFLALSLLPSFPENYRIPPWLTLLVVSRDLLILAGAVMIHLVRWPLEIRPSRLGKITTFLQMMTIGAALLGLPFRGVVYPPTACFTLLSGFGYLRYGLGFLR